jgi:hypothetical protein
VARIQAIGLTILLTIAVTLGLASMLAGRLMFLPGAEVNTQIEAAVAERAVDRHSAIPMPAHPHLGPAANL